MSQKTQMKVLFVLLLAITGITGRFALAFELPEVEIRVETESGASGELVPEQTLSPGDTLTVYAVARDEEGTYLHDVHDADWSLADIEGDVEPADLQGHGDGSATFTADDPGSAHIKAQYDELTPVPSGKITVQTEVLPPIDDPLLSPLSLSGTWVGEMSGWADQAAYTDLGFDMDILKLEIGELEPDGSLGMRTMEGQAMATYNRPESRSPAEYRAFLDRYVMIGSLSGELGTQGWVGSRTEPWPLVESEWRIEFERFSWQPGGYQEAWDSDSPGWRWMDSFDWGKLSVLSYPPTLIWQKDFVEVNEDVITFSKNIDTMVREGEIEGVLYKISDDRDLDYPQDFPPDKTVNTDQHTRKTINIPDVGEVTVNPDSEPSVDSEGGGEGEKTNIEHFRGKLRHKVQDLEGTYEVQAPQAVLGVRGTTLWTIVDEDREETRANLLEGDVEVSEGLVSQLNAAGAGAVFVATEGKVDHLIASESVTASIEGGEVEELHIREDCALSFTAGTAGGIHLSENGDVVMSGGTSGEIRAKDESSVEISDGSVEELRTMGNSRTEISGGAVEMLHAAGESQVDISGGMPDELLALESGSINIYGDNFTLEGEDVEWGDNYEIIGDGLLHGQMRDTGEDFSVEITENSAESRLRAIEPAPAHTFEESEELGGVEINIEGVTRITTGEDGTADVELDDGAYNWTATKYGYQDSYGEFEATDGGEEKIEFTMDEHANEIRVETEPDGTGEIVPGQKLNPGDEITVYAVERDEDGEFVETVTDAEWLLDDIRMDEEEGVKEEDLEDIQDGSATFSADGLGSAVIRAERDSMTAVPSGRISVTEEDPPGLQELIDEAIDEGEDLVVVEDNYSLSEPVVIDEDGLTLRSTFIRTGLSYIDAGDVETAIIVEADDVTVEGLWIGGYTDTGISVEGSNATISANLFYDMDDLIQGSENGSSAAIAVKGPVEGARIMNNFIPGHETGIENRPEGGQLPGDTRAVHNNFLENQHAVVWDGESELNATYNFWGHKSGPSGDGDGEGDAVSGNVDFSNWVSAETAGRGALARTGELAEEALQGLGISADAGELLASGFGGMNPTDVEFDGGPAAYAQIIGLDKTDLSEITFAFGFPEEAGELVKGFWLDDDGWTECSIQELVEDPERFEDFEGYIEVMIGEDTSPSIDDLSGMTLALGPDPDELPDHPEIRVETADDGTGQVVPEQEIEPEEDITAYAVARDEDGEFEQVVEEASWELVDITGGVEQGDLTDHGDGSATFTADAPGSATMKATEPLGILSPVPSGTITVIVDDPPEEYTVTFQEENGLEGVEIVVKDVDSITTGDDGEASISLRDGTYNWEATKEGYYSDDGEFVVDGEAKNVYLSLDPTEVPVDTVIQDLIDEAIEDEKDYVEIEPEHYASAEPIIIDEPGFTLRSEEGRDVTFIDAECEDVAIEIVADDVTVEGFWIGNFSEAGIVVSGDNARIVDNVVDGYCEISDEKTGVAIAVLGDGARIHGNETRDAVNAGIGFDGVPAGTRIFNNTITGNVNAGIGNKEGSQPVDTIVIHNNIGDNEGLGIYWDAAEELNAAHNWWGYETGPYHEAENPDGEGDEVSGNVEFAPWTGAQTRGRGTSVTRDAPRAEDPEQGIGLESDGGEASASVSDDNPTGVVFDDADEGAAYTQLVIMDKDDMTEIKLDIHFSEPSNKNIFWLDDENWVECSHQEVFDEPLQDYAEYGHDGYVRVTIGSETSPSFEDFSSRVFTFGGEEDIVDDDDDDDDDSWYDCFIATAAYGTPTATEIDALRVFRDDVLLNSPAGKKAVETYYRLSPPVANLIRQSNTARAIVRQGLQPLVDFCDNPSD